MSDMQTNDEPPAGAPPAPPAGAPAQSAEETAKTGRLTALLGELRATRSEPQDQSAQAASEATPAPPVFDFTYPEQRADLAIMQGSENEADSVAAHNRMQAQYAAHMQKQIDAGIAAGIDKARNDYFTENQQQSLVQKQAGIIKQIAIESVGSQAKYELIEPLFVQEMQTMTAHDPSKQLDPAVIGAALNSARTKFAERLANAQNPDAGATRSRGAPVSQTKPQTGIEDTRAFLKRVGTQ